MLEACGEVVSMTRAFQSGSACWSHEEFSAIWGYWLAVGSSVA